jgi:hypothetical protein
VVWVTVTLEPPVFFRVAAKVCVVPTVTDPKLKVAELRLRVPAVMALPVRETANAGVEPVLVIVRLELSLPEDCGEKITLKDVACPAPIVNGKLKPFTV